LPLVITVEKEEEMSSIYWRPFQGKALRNTLKEKSKKAGVGTKISPLWYVSIDHMDGSAFYSKKIRTTDKAVRALTDNPQSGSRKVTSHDVKKKQIKSFKLINRLFH
jgi:hypothetical protein